MDLRDLVGLNVVKAVDDASADLQILWSLAQPPPALQRTGAEAPTPRELNLIEMPDVHGANQCVSNSREGWRMPCGILGWVSVRKAVRIRWGSKKVWRAACGYRSSQ